MSEPKNESPSAATAMPSPPLSTGSAVRDVHDAAAAPTMMMKKKKSTTTNNNNNGSRVMNVVSAAAAAATPVSSSSSSSFNNTAATTPKSNTASSTKKKKTQSISSSTTKKTPKSSAAETTTPKRKSTASKKKTPKSSKPANNNNNNKSSSPTDSSSSPSSSKSSPLSYTDMAHEAIVSLQDRTGSSLIAIQKYILSKYSHLEDGKLFRSRLNTALKHAVKKERFCKIKNSYKIHSAYKKKQQIKKKKEKALEQKKKLEKERQLKREKEEAKVKLTPAQQEAARLAKLRKDKLKKRRYPMEDTKLHLEDKELRVKPPDDVRKRPSLPYFFQTTTLPFDSDRRQGRTPSNVLTASKVEQLEFDNRGLVPDLLQVYHFFRGDVRFQQVMTSEEVALVPEFTLKHLIFAVDEVSHGNAKKSRMLPPLLTHLFVTCLRLLTTSTTSTSTMNRRLQQDLSKLNAGLSPASWAEVCFQYVDTMEHYYSTDASFDPNVLPPNAIDVEYLMRASSQEAAVASTPLQRKTKPSENDNDVVLPDGYGAYVGDRSSSLAKAYEKLSKMDPWNLTAEELMAVLRALTDDVLSTNPAIGEDISKRDEEMHELLKAKRAADTQFRKIRLAYEGPKNASRSSSSKGAKEKSTEEKPSEEASPRKQLAASEDGGSDTEEKSKEDKKKPPAFKPTASKKQFEKAKKDQQKAHDAYQKGLRNLVARTEPVGYDRHYNAVYYFQHDPEVLYVEMLRGPTAAGSNVPEHMLMNRMSWHVIETKSTFDDFVASLDIRGSRENDLYESMLGPEGGHYSLRRGLYDDVKERSAIAARRKEREELDRKLENAKIAVDAEEIAGRRSGRLQSRAEIDLAAVEKEIEVLDKKIAADAVPEELDYEELTGLKLVKKFDAVGRRTRRSRELKALSVTRDLPDMPSSKLLPTGNIDGTGAVGMAMSELLEIEELCESLVPWERTDVPRDRWIADCEDLIQTWNNSCQLMLGPDDVEEASEGASAAGTPACNRYKSIVNTPSTSDSKRRKLDRSDSPSSSVASQSNVSTSQILSTLRMPLLALEQRVFEITGLAMAAQDADEADDNMSTTSDNDDEEQEEQKLKLAWKKLIHSLRSVPSRRYSQIREIVVEAIAAARKAQLPAVVAKLRSALLLHHPTAASECKNAALATLDNFGGYEEDSDDSDDDQSDAGDEAEEEEEELPSLLSGEAMSLTGSLDGDQDANRIDWIDAVKSCKTLSRWAALTYGFTRHAAKKLEKIHEERDVLNHAVDVWKKEEDRRARSRAGKPGSSSKGSASKEEPTEVWANVDFTDEFCMAKVESFPWWPAKKCRVKDQELASDLHSVGRMLVSLIGEDGGLRAVRFEDVRPFTGQIIEEDSTDESYSKTTRGELEDCMAMARRILRGRKRRSNDRGGYVEEKKTAM